MKWYGIEQGTKKLMDEMAWNGMEFDNNTSMEQNEIKHHEPN